MQERNLQMAYKIAEAAEKHGGRAYYVGGYVRDFLLGKVCYDIDIEVHGIEPDALSFSNSCLELVIFRYSAFPVSTFVTTA